MCLQLIALSGEQLGEHYVQKLTAQAADLGNQVGASLLHVTALHKPNPQHALAAMVQGMQTAVAAALRQQLIAISTSLHNCLLDAEDPMPAAQHAMLVSNLLPCYVISTIALVSLS